MVRSEPSRVVYWFDMPTYGDSSLVWQGGSPNLSGQYRFVNINGRIGRITGGPERMAGRIRKWWGGQPIPVVGLRVILLDSTEVPFAFTYTDSTGHFEFPAIPFGKHKVWVDKPYIENGDGPEVFVYPAVELDQLEFWLHPTWLELENLTSLEAGIEPITEAYLAPNPYNERLRLILNLKEVERVSLEVFDLQGRVLGMNDLGILLPGSHSFSIAGYSHIPSGLYIVHLNISGEIQKLKLLKR